MAADQMKLRLGFLEDLQRIIQEYAEKMLNLPLGVYPHEEIKAYRRYDKAVKKLLEGQHRLGESGLIICRAQTWAVDLMIIQVCQRINEIYQKTVYGKKKIKFAVVALGGYGRRELNPCSDIDLMFLHRGKTAEEQGEEFREYVKLVNEQLLYTLYDIPFKVGYSVRNLDECIEIINQDIQTKTSLIETRCIIGDEELYERLRKCILKECAKHHVNEYVRDRQMDQERRYSKYGNSPTMLEPNLKNGCGGLRDLHNLIWLSWFKLRSWDMSLLCKKGHLTIHELNHLNTAHDFLLRVRNELHYLTGRCNDVLSKAHQPAVAAHLGYKDKSPAERIEKFMHELYTQMRNIHLIASTLEGRFALAPEKGILPSITSFFKKKSNYSIDVFRVVDGWVKASSMTALKRDPGKVMRLFLIVQQRGLSIHPDLIHSLRERYIYDTKLFKPSQLMTDLFLEILHQRGSVAPILRLMHETHFLGKFIPEFDKLTCLVQHEFFHRYTADEHTLMCIEQLDRVWQAVEYPYAQFEDIFQKIEEPHILYLSLLLHDIGKSSHKRNHAIQSAEMAYEVAKRIGLKAEDIESLLFLVENHLYLFEVATQRDIYNPKVIQEVAQKVRTPERLNQLLLICFADTLGTSKDLWNGYKELLLWSIYKNTMKLLQSPREDDTMEGTIRQRRRLIKEVLKSSENELTIEIVEKHLDAMSARYRRFFSPKQIAQHILMIHALFTPVGKNSQMPVFRINWEKLKYQGCSRVTVCTYHQRGIFNKICGALTACELTIFNAQIAVRKDGIALNSFNVLNADEANLVPENCRKRFYDILGRVFYDRGNLEEEIEKLYGNKPSYVKRSRPHFSIPLEIVFDLESSPKYTILQIQSEDYIGLLYEITKVMVQMGMDLVASYNLTEKGVAIDRFLLTDSMGNKVTDLHRLSMMETNLRNAIRSLNQRAYGKNISSNCKVIQSDINQQKESRKLEFPEDLF